MFPGTAGPHPMTSDIDRKDGPLRRHEPADPTRKVPQWLLIVAAMIAVAHVGAIAYGFATGGAYLALALFGGLMLVALGAIAYINASSQQDRGPGRP